LYLIIIFLIIIDFVEVRSWEEEKVESLIVNYRSLFSRFV